MPHLQHVVHALLPQREVVQVGELHALPAVAPAAVERERLTLERPRLGPVVPLRVNVGGVADNGLVARAAEEVLEQPAQARVGRDHLDLAVLGVGAAAEALAELVVVERRHRILSAKAERSEEGGSEKGENEHERERPTRGGSTAVRDVLDGGWFEASASALWLTSSAASAARICSSDCELRKAYLTSRMLRRQVNFSLQRSSPVMSLSRLTEVSPTRAHLDMPLASPCLAEWRFMM
jgi:hypothetical protein